MLMKFHETLQFMNILMRIYIAESMMYMSEIDMGVKFIRKEPLILIKIYLFLMCLLLMVIRIMKISL